MGPGKGLGEVRGEKKGRKYQACDKKTDPKSRIQPLRLVHLEHAG